MSVKPNFKRTFYACGTAAALILAQSAGQAQAPAANPWMAQTILAEQSAAQDDAAREAVANRRARMLIAAMSLPQKMQQLVGAKPEILAELPHCFGARHVSRIAELNIPTRTDFVRLIKSARQAKARSNEARLKGLLKEAPTEFQRLARRAMDRFIEKDLPQIRAASSTADKLLYGDAGEVYFVRESLDEDVREYDRLVAREWDRVTRGEADDPAVVATVCFFVATGLPPKASMLLREAKEVIRNFRTNGFDTQAVIKFIDDHAPEAIREDLRKSWEDDLKGDAEEQLNDNDPNWPDTHMERALEYLRKTCSVSWKARRR